jgi:tRNA modification GTPase
MNKNTNTIDTIVAQATPSGRAGIGIIRVSGPKVKKIAKKIIGRVPKPHYASFTSFLNKEGKAIDQGISLFFPVPNSFTGEDILELHGHGGPMVMDCLLRRVVELGARLAKPGEFSERAFLNDKIDLVQAESIVDLITASSEQAVYSAMRSMQGMFSEKVDSLVKQLIDLRVTIEAALDFSEEETDYISKQQIDHELKNILLGLRLILENAEQGALLQHGVSVVIVGKPNVGKSSLLNYLCRKNSAIVTNIPGTTRDVLREYINLDGLPLHIIDTAGLRESHDLIEEEGIKRAWQEMQKADFILLIIDEDEINLTAFEQYLDKVIVVRNKIDLLEEDARIERQRSHDILYVSVKTGAGLDLLENHLKSMVGFNRTSEDGFIARLRHLQSLKKAEQHLSVGRNLFDKKYALELLAEELRRAQNALSELTGEFCSDDLLGKIFSEFCIGK